MEKREEKFEQKIVTHGSKPIINESYDKDALVIEHKDKPVEVKKHELDAKVVAHSEGTDVRAVKETPIVKEHHQEVIHEHH